MPTDMEDEYQEEFVPDIVFASWGCLYTELFKAAVQDGSWGLVFSMLKIDTDKYPEEHFEILDDPCQMGRIVRWK